MATPAAARDSLVTPTEAIPGMLADLNAAEGPDLSEVDDGADSEEVPSTWVDEDNGEDDDALTEDLETTKKARKGAPDIREYKANGKTHRIDMSDRKAVDELISLGLGARPVFSERDKLTKAVKTAEAEKAELRKYKDLWDKLEARKHDKAALYESIFGEKWADAIKRDREWQDKYDAASPQEKTWMDHTRKLEAERVAMQEEARQRAVEAKKLEDRQSALDLKEIKAHAIPAFHKYEFSDKIKDQAAAEKMNKALWKLAINDLKDNYGDLDEVPPHAIRKAFRETHDMLWSSHKSAADDTVKKITANKKKTATEQAQIASTRNYGGKTANLQDLSKEKDPVKLWKKMFR